MSFPGKPAEAPKEPRERTFRYLSKAGVVHVRAHEVYFYSSGHVAFVNHPNTEKQSFELVVHNLQEFMEVTE